MGPVWVQIAPNTLKPCYKTQNRAKRINRLDNRNCLGTRGSEVQIVSPRPFNHPKQLIGLASIPNYGISSIWVRLGAVRNLPPSEPPFRSRWRPGSSRMRYFFSRNSLKCLATASAIDCVFFPPRCLLTEYAHISLLLLTSIS